MDTWMSLVNNGDNGWQVDVQGMPLWRLPLSETEAAKKQALRK